MGVRPAAVLSPVRDPPGGERHSGRVARPLQAPRRPRRGV